MMKAEKYITKITTVLLIILFCVGCVDLDPEYEPIKPDKIPAKKGDWVQIIDRKISKPLLLDFESGEFFEYSADYYYSGKWDVSIAPLSVSVNNYNENGDYYKGIMGNVLGVLLPKNFDDITEAPNPEKKVYNRHMDALGNFSKDIEGYEYDIIAGDGLYYWGKQLGYDAKNVRIGTCVDHKHIDKKTKKVTTLPMNLPKRTFVFRTNEGNFVKLQIQNIYKNNPKLPTPESEYGYMSFRYFIQKDGSRNLLTE